VNRERQDEMYAEAVSMHGATMRRTSRAYEADPDKQRDLLQDIHLELWQSLASFDGRCGLNTWVFRVSHNVAASHVERSRRVAARLVDLETLETEVSLTDSRGVAVQRCSAESLLDLIRRLKPLDRQIIVLYLEGEPAAAIAEVTGLSASNVATRIHRIKKLLKHIYVEGALHVTG
jgi:RNA polymerase sigma-70 factor (ECF subfamily)